MLEENFAAAHKAAAIQEDALHRRIEEMSPTKDSLVRIVSPMPNRPSDHSLSQTTIRRDWASAIELVNEACEAIRLAEEKASAAERYSEELSRYHIEQTKLAELKISSLEKRVENAEGRANEAEDWLLRFHDAIMDGFRGVLKTK